MFRPAWLLIIFLLFINGCSLLPKEVDKTKDWSAQKFYVEATEAMSVGDYEQAIKYYELLESRYPFGKYAMQAQLNVAYAHFKRSEPDAALASADRFIKLYPNSPASAYAYYLKGLINFTRSLGFLDRFIPTDVSQRDPGASTDAYKDFAELIKKFPETEYAEDARRRLLYLRNNLARHEIHVANYYIKRGAFLAAANRAVYVVENFQRTPAMRDALEVMIDVYTRLELTELATDAQRVLALNEQNGNFILDPAENLEEKTWGVQIWDYLELDEN